MFNTTKTWTTSYGYSQTITLAEAMSNRSRNETCAALTNLGRVLAFAPMALGLVAGCKTRKTPK